jgi:gliding motility-associated-like protein
MIQFAGALLALLLSPLFAGLSWAQTASLAADETAPCLTFIPPAISPNGDGINDRFELRYSCEIEAFSLKVFNTEQQLVHASADINQAWDGSSHGSPLPEGPYTWTITYQSRQGKLLKESGTLMLIR